MNRVLFIHHYPKQKTVSEVRVKLLTRGAVTEVHELSELKTALRTSYDEVAVLVDSMTTLKRLANILNKHSNTKNAHVSIWQVNISSLRGGMSITYRPTDIAKQLADMAKTKGDALEKGKV